MGLGNSIGNALKSSTGNITKAFLAVRNPAKIWERDENGKLKKITMSDSEVNNAAKTQAKNIYDNIKKYSSSSSRISAENFANEFGGSDADYLLIEVQYNPEMINVSSEYGRFLEYNGGLMGGSTGSTALTRDVPMNHTFSTRLILDDMVADDCFGASFNTSVTSLVKNVVSYGTNNGHTVKDKVDLLITLNLLKELSDVYFIYGTMMFHGELTSVDAHYTMFNMSGNPVRATVDITLSQYNGKSRLYAYDTMEWNSKYTNFIKDHKSETTS